MALAVGSLIRRNMKSTCCFIADNNPRNLPIEFKLFESENLIGWYRNPNPWKNCTVIFTTKAIYSVEGDREVCIPLDQIIDYETPDPNLEVTGIRIMISDGFRYVRIAGTHGPLSKHKDVFNLAMILNVLTNLNTK